AWNGSFVCSANPGGSTAGTFSISRCSHATWGSRLLDYGIRTLDVDQGHDERVVAARVPRTDRFAALCSSGHGAQVSESSSLEYLIREAGHLIDARRKRCRVWCAPVEAH